MKKITIIVLLSAVCGLSDLASAVESGLSEDEITYPVDATSLYGGDDACTAGGEISVVSGSADEDSDHDVCDPNSVRAALAANVRQRIESIIDWVIAMDSAAVQ
jgi:hypothetical protein|tara:strand:- start:5750 stop:6061 length:312 start_codon:yes stop_codon:yes gene_type:complete